MYRKRLRDAPDAAELAQLYQRPHDARAFGHGHHLRVLTSVVVTRWMAVDFQLTSAADLSTGNAQIPDSLPRTVTEVALGDFAPGYEYQGPIEETIDKIPAVDLFILSETIEHLDDPEAMLERIRSKARFLFLSTPIGEADQGNPEHLWGWDVEAVEEMLQVTGWPNVKAQFDLNLPGTYSYQLWAVERAS